MVGNFIADSVKGRRWNDYSPAVSQGILMHRAIDSFTDTHALVSESKQLLRPHYGLYSGILVDLFYDHFLAAGWHRFSALPLAAFAAKVYAVLESYLPIMPERNRIMFPYMKQENWLIRYATVNGIRLTLHQLSRRMPSRPDFTDAHEFLLRHHELLQQHFDRFFPDLQNFLHNRWPSAA